MVANINESSTTLLFDQSSRSKTATPDRIVIGKPTPLMLSTSAMLNQFDPEYRPEQKQTNSSVRHSF